MRVVLTEPALEDIEEIRAYLAIHYPQVAPSVERRFRLAFARIAEWPESAQQAAQRPGVRIVPLVRYPYNIFYRIKNGTVEVVHIYHAARR